MATAPSIVWLRQDFRLEDNPALLAAVEREAPILPIYIWAPEEEGDWPPGAASRWWIHQSLKQLHARLEKVGLRLLVRRGPTQDTIHRLVEETGAGAVFWNRRYEPAVIERDSHIKNTLHLENRVAECFNSALLFEPHKTVKEDGDPYRVFTPFWKSCLARPEPEEPVPAPTRLPSPNRWPDTLAIEDLKLEPTIDWAEGLRETWSPGEEGAQAALDAFLEEGILRYNDNRDRPDKAGTSRLSPHLHFGELSPRRVWHAVRRRAADAGEEHPSGPAEFLRQLGWREFSYCLLYHYPQITTNPLREEFGAFPWENDRASLHAWQKGQTGYPLVDAGMKELWRIGWMHNRVRMVVASFLVKHLRIHWLEGARWFWDTLVDADLANNTMGWQWTAGCGADAAPYFRIFNPTTQAAKFDPEGNYIHRWVPALQSLRPPDLYKPWTLSDTQRTETGVRLGDTYPNPLVDHSEAREQALAGYETIKRAARSESSD